MYVYIYTYRPLPKSIGPEILMDSNTSGLYGTRAPLFHQRVLKLWKPNMANCYRSSPATPGVQTRGTPGTATEQAGCPW